MGCSGFVAECLGKKQKHTSKWTRGAKVNKADLKAGDVVGWGGNGADEGHVCIWDDNVFLNCPGPGKKVKINNSMDHDLYRMSY